MLDVAERLLRTGRVDPDESYTFDDFSCIHEAARKGMADLVELLLSTGADVNKRCCEERTALIYACDRGRTAVVKLLLAREDVEVRSDSSSIVF